MNTNIKLTENEVVEKLIQHLQETGWTIVDRCLSHEKGLDILATNKGKTLVVEAKGARANDNAPTKKRNYFSSGQIKTHFGVAIVKILDEMSKHPDRQYAIAHPEDSDIKKHIGHMIPLLSQLGITHFWVNSNGSIIEK